MTMDTSELPSKIYQTKVDSMSHDHCILTCLTAFLPPNTAREGSIFQLFDATSVNNYFCFLAIYSTEVADA